MLGHWASFGLPTQVKQLSTRRKSERPPASQRPRQALATVEVRHRQQTVVESVLGCGPQAPLGVKGRSR